MKLFLLALIAGVCLAVKEGEEKPNFACSLSGDPHFKSFDGVNFDFQGKGWFDLVAHPHLKISAEFYDCGAASSKVTCMKNAYIWTDACVNGLTADGCPILQFSLQNGVATYAIGQGLTKHTMEQGDVAALPGTYGAKAGWKSGQLTASGCIKSNCWTATLRTGMVVITMTNPGSTADVQWGSTGICGTPDGDSTNEFQTADNHVVEGTPWRSHVPDIAAWGQSHATPSNGNKDHLNTYLGATQSTPTQPTLLSDAEITAILACTQANWINVEGVNLCRDEVIPACKAEGEETACIIDYCRAWQYSNGLKNQDYLDQSKGWTEERRTAASLYNAAIAVDQSVMLGLFIGLGVGLVFIVAAVAFFAKNPELLPFTHKKKKIQKELAATDVLK